MKTVVVRMPEASARDKLAVTAELSHRGDLIEPSELIIGVWSNGEALVVKDRAATAHGILEFEGDATVVKGRSFK